VYDSADRQVLRASADEADGKLKAYRALLKDTHLRPVRDKSEGQLIAEPRYIKKQIVSKSAIDVRTRSGLGDKSEFFLGMCKLAGFVNYISLGSFLFYVQGPDMFDIVHQRLCKNSSVFQNRLSKPSTLNIWTFKTWVRHMENIYIYIYIYMYIAFLNPTCINIYIQHMSNIYVEHMQNMYNACATYMFNYVDSRIVDRMGTLLAEAAC
jgi:hypothetical protein